MTKHWFFIGMISFLLGQVIRSIRWQILLPENTEHKKRQLLLYTSIGSLLNTVLPLRSGDLVRAVMLSRGIQGVRFSTSLASVIVERMTDGIFILAAVLLISNYQDSILITIEPWMLLVPSTIIAISLFTKHSSHFKRFIHSFSSLWNPVIQTAILDFFWMLSLQITHKRFFSWRYLTSTLLMWGCYLFSYTCFYLTFPQLRPLEVLKLFHNEKLNGSLTTAYEARYSPEIIIALTLFLLTPILFALIYSYFFSESSKNRQLRQFSLSTFGLPSSFSGKGAYSNFLHSYFSTKAELLSKLGVEGFEDCKISRVFHGGSGAITAVIEKSEGLSIRKVANLSEALKLRDQFIWLQSASNRGLPTTTALNFVNRPNFCYYEMPYILGSIDMHEWIHAVPVESSKKVLENLVSVISKYHDTYSECGIIDKGLDEYLKDKVIKNIEGVRSALSQFINPVDFTINGSPFSIKEWEFLEEIGLLRSFMSNAPQTDIHGDLTIDNLIIDSSQNWILIDPNPSTTYKSALMDWGKLLQSLHTGYEFLDRDTKITFDQSSIRFASYRSDKYQELSSLLMARIVKKYGEDGLREAFLHEIIHYLRLLPYKFKVNDEKGLLFFAVTCKIIRKFREKYEIT